MVEPGRNVMRVGAILSSEGECGGKAKVTESGGGRVNSGKLEVFVRGMLMYSLVKRLVR